MGSRFASIIGIVLLAYGFLMFRLYKVQLTQGGYYLAEAQSQANAADFETSQRGTIYFTDKDGGSLAVALNQDFNQVYAVPKAVGDIQETAHSLSLALNIPAEDIVKEISDPTASFVSLAKKVSDATVSQVLGFDLPGVYVDDTLDRFYPFDNLAAQTIGFVGPDPQQVGEETGLYGLEREYNNLLSGSSGGSNGTVNLVGQDLNLTIDPNIQEEVESDLTKLISDNNATGGSVIVEEPKTGKILAAASEPTYDPNTYSSFGLATFLNPITEHLYEPGSVFKVFTMSAGIDSGKLTPETTYYDSGSVTINGYRITNYDLKTHGPYGTATMTNVIEHSINTGAVFAEGRTGNAIFTNYIKRFGLGEKTGVDLPGELAGNLSRLNPKSPQVAFATASYGQGVAVTPLELISAVAAIANGGTLMRPYLNAALSPESIRNVISTSTAAQVTQMMISAVDKAGVATIEGYSIAGKTGTAFIPDLIHGGYTNNVIDSYVGFGPTSDPRFIVLVKVDTLPSTSLAAESVVPAFRNIAQYLINYYNIPPDRPVAVNAN